MNVDLLKQVGFGEIALLDIQTIDGQSYFLTDSESPGALQYPALIGGGSQTYKPWLKSVGPIVVSRDFTTDAGDVVLQNLSGSTIDRDVASAIKNHEWEGALAILRFYLPLFADVVLSFYGTLTEQAAPEEEATFRLVQLCDVSQYSVADDVIGELCTFRFKSKQCGSTGSAVACGKRFVDCTDATRAVRERFNAILNPPPSNTVANIPPVITT
jgi:hypothetical protein